MNLLKSDRAKIEILRCLSKEGNYVNDLKKKVGFVNYASLKRSIYFLSCIGLVSIEHHQRGSRKYNWVSITKLGREALDFLESSSKRCHSNA
jgi:DNA-binding HxlR family transcriptional regulator